MNVLGTGVVATLVYGVIGTGLMALGFILVDLAIPGKLREQIWDERNPNAAIMLGSSLLGVGIIVAVAIFTTEDDLVAGIVSTVVYGLIGLALMGLAFVLIDIAVPGKQGKLGQIMADATPHPAAWVSAAAHLAIAGIIAAAIS